MTMVKIITCSGGARFTTTRQKWCHREVQEGRNIMSFGTNGKRHHGARCRNSKLNRGTSIAAFDVGGYYGADDGIHVGVDHVKESSGGRQKVAVEELDHWLHNSVQEIVKNIDKAPLLVQVYTDDGPESSPSLSPSPSSSSSSSSSPSPTKLVIEKAASDTWPFIKQRWENSSKTVPNGIILVEELDSNANSTTQQDYRDNSCLLDYSTSNSSSSNRTEELTDLSHATRLWGVIVQGRGVSYPTCYLLKTCQVKCCFGLSTHFCLAKVDCFGKNVDFHLNNFWLQR